MTASERRPRPSEKRPLPLSIGLCLAACLAALPLAALGRRSSFALAYGDTLLVESLLAFGLAWVGYLKRDGIRILPARARKPGESPRSWTERMPSLGAAPPPPAPLPGEGGPEDPAYQRLAAAEERLRERILGTGADERPGAERRAEAGIPAEPESFGRTLALVGSVLFALGLCFEYLVPRLFR